MYKQELLALHAMYYRRELIALLAIYDIGYRRELTLALLAIHDMSYIITLDPACVPACLCCYVSVNRPA